MAVNLIVLGVTVLLLGYAVSWSLSAPLRAWMEEPKARFEARARRFPQTRRSCT